ncbi:MAG: 3-dehydroquinate synthase [Chthonomonadales bacterium]
MPEIRVTLPSQSYPIHVGYGNLDNVASQIISGGKYTSCLIVSHPKLQSLYASGIEDGLTRSDLRTSTFTIAPGERYKSLRTVERIYTEMLRCGLDRKSLLVSVGGGVLGDMVGFAAATYMRGIDFVQVPTTLLAQVDAAIGGKTGVDYRHGKNLVGAFHQPNAVFVDVKTLATLPTREFRSGLAEVIKYGIISDNEFFAILRGSMRDLLNLDRDALLQAVSRCCQIKADVVSADEKEGGLRAILNYGHTLGHAIESVTNYRRFTHGEAISIGMVAAAQIGIEIGFTPVDVLDQTIELLTLAGLPTKLPGDLSHDALIETTAFDKKGELGKPAYVLANRIGSVEVVKGIENEIVRQVLRRITAMP